MNRPPPVPSRIRQPKLLFGLALAALVSGCQPTEDCGKWVFSGTASSNGSEYSDAYNVSSAFTFNPKNCGKDCDCKVDCIIQMVRIYDSSEHKYVYSNSHYSDRATSDGWSIDQLWGWAYGYYGLNNDGVTFDAAFNPTGSNGNPTTLYDQPGGWENNITFYSVDVAVSFQAEKCNNRILGYYFWSFTVDNSAKAAGYLNAPGWQPLDADFQKAVSHWNSWAPLQGAQNESIAEGPPGQPIDPTCYPFPTLKKL